MTTSAEASGSHVMATISDGEDLMPSPEDGTPAAWSVEVDSTALLDREVDPPTTVFAPPTSATAVLKRPRDIAVADPWGVRVSAASASESEPVGRWPRLAAWLIPAVAMAVVGGLGITRPALWTDEFATWGMATASWDRMWGVLRYLDAVIAPYYLLVRAGTALLGGSDLALRLPSLAAMVLAAGLVGSLGRRLAGPRAGILAGLLLAVLPAASRFAQEARPYAMTALLAVAATYLLVLSTERATFWRLAGYALAVTALGLMHVVALLLLLAHGWIVVAWHRPLLARWVAAATAGVLPLLPLLWVGHRQSGQVSYIPRVGFDSVGPYGSVVLGSAVLLLVLVLLGLFALPLRRPAVLFSAWVVVPAAALVVVSLAVPLFLPRYLIFTLPGWALLAGFTLDRLRTPLAAGALVLVAALGLPAQLAERRADGHDEATRTAADVIAAGSRPGDAIVYASGEARGGWTARDLVAHYVPAARRPADRLLVRPQRSGGQILAGECADVARCLGRPGRVWVLRIGRQADPLAGLGAGKQRVLRAGYHVERTWQLRNVTVALMSRNPAA
jgi:mannosyltransferase